jgi:hypothetical protein
MSDVVLIVIYNHQYNKNIDVIEKIYDKKFSNIFHLVPFYNGNKENVIPVYDNSYYFQGYIAQGFKSFFKKEYNHYFFIADDMILNPKINENNYFEYLNLNNNTSFFTEFIHLHKVDYYWPRIEEAFNWSLNIDRIEVERQIPEFDLALKEFQRNGFELKPLRFNQIWPPPKKIAHWIRMYTNSNVIKHLKFTFDYLKNRDKKYNLPYPILGGYSDIFVVNHLSIKNFCHLCGVFASTKLFVELAIPTALVLSSKYIATESDIKLKGKALWTKDELDGLDKYDGKLQNIINHFPSNQLYIHPVKLSKYNTTL